MNELINTGLGTVNVLPGVVSKGASNAKGNETSEIGCEAAPVETPTNVSFQEFNAGSKRVLVADDDPMTLRMLKSIVEAEGYQAVLASDGKEVIDILELDNQFTAALFDMWMPEIPGMDLIRIMKSDERLSHIPVALISSERDLKIWSESTAAGASIFLPKPFSPSHVQMALRMLVSKQVAAEDPIA